jgi:DnaK suppressor protein
MKSALTAAQRQSLVTALQARLHDIENQLRARQQGLSSAEQALATREQGGNDAVQLASDREVEATLTDIEEREMLALSAALRRVHEDDYGLCTSCGQVIPYGRLHIEPQAQRCVACETLHEKAQLT